MSHSDRRKFLRSLSRTAFVLPFADILALTVPLQQQELNAAQTRRLARSSAATTPSPLLLRRAPNLQLKARRSASALSMW